MKKRVLVAADVLVILIFISLVAFLTTFFALWLQTFHAVTSGKMPEVKGWIYYCQKFVLPISVACLSISGLTFLIWMLVDSIKRSFADETARALWILIILLSSVIGAIVYYFFYKRKELLK